MKAALLFLNLISNIICEIKAQIMGASVSPPLLTAPAPPFPCN